MSGTFGPYEVSIVACASFTRGVDAASACSTSATGAMAEGCRHDPRLDSRELQHTFDGLTQAASFGADGCAVLLDPGRVLDDSMRQIVGRRSNHGNGSAQLVRHARDEFELLPREPLRAPRRNDDQANAIRPSGRECRSSAQGSAVAPGRPRLRANPARCPTSRRQRDPSPAPGGRSAADVFRRPNTPTNTLRLESRPSGFCTVRIVVEAWRISGN